MFDFLLDHLESIGLILVSVGYLLRVIYLWFDGVGDRAYLPSIALGYAIIALGLLFQVSSQREELVSRRRQTIAFNSPVNMSEGDVDTAELIIDKGSQDSILNSLRELQPKDSPLDDRATDIMPLAKPFPTIVATLEGIGFTILPSGPQKREGEFRWSWQIKAEQSTTPSLKGDDRLLSIRLEGQTGTGQTAKITLLNGPQPRRVHVVPKTITLVQQVIDWLKDLNPYVAGIGGVIVAISGWLSRGILGRMWRRFRHGPDFDQT
jgi:hypothetical protein